MLFLSAWTVHDDGRFDWARERRWWRKIPMVLEPCILKWIRQTSLLIAKIKKALILVWIAWTICVCVCVYVCVCVCVPTHVRACLQVDSEALNQETQICNKTAAHRTKPQKKIIFMLDIKRVVRLRLTVWEIFFSMGYVLTATGMPGLIYISFKNNKHAGML